jgi:uncharacterized membrane protein
MKESARRYRAWISLGAAAILGVIAVVLVPPAITYDGPSHFFRAVQVSEGHLRADRYSDVQVGGTLPARFVEFVNPLWQSYWVGHDFGTRDGWSKRAHLAEGFDRRERVEFTNTAVYSPLNYLLPAIGMRLAGWFSRSPLWASRFACLFNLGGFLAITGLAVSLMPRFKEGVLLVATCPLVVIQAASTSTDGINVALPLLMLALVWNLRDGGTLLSRKKAYAALVVGLGVALLKPTSIVCLGCALLIPSVCLGGERRKWACLAGYYLAALGLWFFWNGAYTDIDIARWFYPGRPALSVQRHWFFEDPLRVLRAYVYWIRYDGPIQWPHLYAGVGGWIPSSLQAAFAWPSIGFLAGLLCCSYWERKADRVWSLSVTFLGVGLVSFTALTLFLSFGQPSDVSISGLADRYLIVPVVCFAMAWSEVFHGRFERARSVVFWATLLLNASCTAAILAPIGTRVW